MTDFADQAVILPVFLVVGLGLTLSHQRRLAVRWLVVIAGLFGVVLVSKLVLISCGQAYFDHELQSPSGHTASAGGVYGGLVGLLLPRRRAWIAVAASVVLVALIGWSRLALGVHTVPEVLVGSAFGVAGAAAVGFRLPEWLASMRRWQLLAAAAGTVLVFYGSHLNPEGMIRANRVVTALRSVCAELVATPNHPVASAAPLDSG